jgi:hypothetical protein
MIKMAFKHSLFVKEKKIDSCFYIWSRCISVANALNSENPLRFRVLGFVDNNKKIHKTDLGVTHI